MHRLHLSTRLLLAGMSLVLGASACDDPSGSDRVRPPAKMEILAGNAQTDTVGQELPQPLVVKVLDARGRPVRDHVVNFVVVSGGGRVAGGSAQTNAEGEARERWTFSKKRQRWLRIMRRSD